jgi:pyruvate/2-oxoacid:ferredoxin oxidoreductase alpha subunit
MAKVLMKGNEAIGAAAINAGCRRLSINDPPA